MGEALSQVSSQRKTEPAKLSALVKGDLDWIVMKALEKDRNRRYDTASAFAADVRRFLAEEPIEARPPSTWYRFRKLARRNKVALTTAALVAAALLVGTAVSTWQAVRATRAENVARLSADAARLSEVAAQDRKSEADAAKDNAEKRSDELAALNEKLRRSNYIADMNLARHAWDENNLALAGELLKRHRPKPGETDLRGFEWHYLHRLPHRDLRTVKAHAGVATTVAWTPDGKRLVSLGTTQESIVHDRARRSQALGCGDTDITDSSAQGCDGQSVSGRSQPGWQAPRRWLPRSNGPGMEPRNRRSDRHAGRAHGPRLPGLLQPRRQAPGISNVELQSS